jgi:hypothetical protein
MAKFSKRMNTGKALICYPDLITPKLNVMADRTQFSCQFVFKKDSKELKALEAAIQECIDKNFPEGIDEEKFKKPIKDGDSVNKARTRKKLAPYPHLVGCKFIQPWSPDTQKPDLYDGQNLVKEPEAAKKLFYSGAFAAGLINMYSYSKSTGEGISMSLLGVQFFNHGERVGGGSGGPTDDLLAPATGTAKPSEGAGDETDEPNFD